MGGTCAENARLKNTKMKIRIKPLNGLARFRGMQKIIRDLSPVIGKNIYFEILIEGSL